MEVIEGIGFVAGIAMALCGAPQAIKSYKDGHSKGISPSFAWLWLSGELGTLVYVLGTIGPDVALLINYITNIFVVLVIMKYLYLPRNKIIDNPIK